MLERLAAWFLNTYVAEYVGNLNTDQLSIGLLSGAVELEKLVLKKDALHKLRLPVEVRAGYIGKLRLQVPVRYIKSQPWVIQIDQLYLIAGPPDLTKYDPDEEAAARQSRKHAKLASMEQKWREEQQRGKSSWFWESFASSFTSTVADNLQVTINDIHIRYEDPEVGGANSPLVIGMIIKQIAAKSTDENWEPKFAAGTNKNFKLVDLCNLNIYWDSEILGELEGQAFMEAMLHKSSSVMATHDMMASSYFSGLSPSTSDLVKPFSAEARITRNCSPNPLKISDGPRINLDIKLQEVPIVLSENQFIQFVELLKVFKLRMRSQKYRNLRPKCSVSENPRIWWEFAMNCITQDIKEHHQRLSLTFVLHRARQCVDYVSAYTTHLTQSSVDDETKKILEEIEKELNFEELVILRHLVMQRIERERALAEEAIKVATKETQQQGFLQYWFPGWGSGSNSTGTIQEESLDEEELLDELGLEMDGSSKLLRDRIFAQVTFHLTKGTLQLVTDEEDKQLLGPQPLLELELSSLSCHFDYRPRLRYSCFEVQLGGVVAYDHYQEESVYSTLVQPKKLDLQTRQPTFQRQLSIKFSRTHSQGEVFQLQLIQQEVLSAREYNLHVVTRPLDVVYNKYTITRIKEFFTLSATNVDEAAQTAAKISGMVGGVDHTLLDYMTIKLDISAPHVIVPKDFTDPSTPMVILDLGHLSFDSISKDQSVLESILLEDESLLDDDDEFVTPPSSPPSETELLEPSQPLPPSEIRAALKKNIQQGNALRKLKKITRYSLQLSEIQVLISHTGSSWQSALIAGRSSLHLLDQFSLLVQIERQSIIDKARLNILANLPLLHFHVDEQKICTLLTCFAPPIDDNYVPSSYPREQPSHVQIDKSMYMSFTDNNSPLSSLSMYKSALNFIDKSHDSHVINKDDQMRQLSSDMTTIKLVQTQINIDEVQLDINSNNRCILELKILNVKGGFMKRVYDLSARLIVEDIFAVDKLQSHGPEYELIVCSSGRGVFSYSPDPSTRLQDSSPRDVFSNDLPFLINLSFLSLSPFSPDHPSVLLAKEGGGYTASGKEREIRRLTLQCTAVDVLANQQTLVELISFSQRALPTHILNGNKKVTPTMDNAEQDQTKLLSSSVTKTTWTQTEISIELEKLGLRMLRGGSGQTSEKTTPTSLLTASMEFFGLGIEARFSSEISIEGYLEGAKVTDLTQEGQKYSSILSLGMCRDGRDLDMITTMMTSYDSLRKMSECAQFSVSRTLHPSSSGQFDIQFSAHVPSILYTHSVNFVREMELFAVDFLRYFVDVTNSMKAAAIDMAKGLVRDKSQLADRLNQLSTTLGGPHLPVDLEDDEEDLEEETDVGVVLSRSDRLLLDVLIKSPVVIVPSSMTSEDTLVAHLGEISIKNSFINKEDETRVESESGCVLCSTEVDEMILRISNMTLHSSHDPASRDWLISEIQDDTPSVCGQWRKILNETSFLLKVERAIGNSGSGQSTPTGDEGNTSLEEVDVKIVCSFPNSLLITLPKEVFDQFKCTAKYGLYQPISRPPIKPIPRPSDPGKMKNKDEPSNEKLPKIYASFSLPRLSIEMKHVIGMEEKNLVFISFEDFFAQCRKTTPHHAYLDLALKTIIIEDLLQTHESYRYILSSTLKPLPFPSPVSTPSSSSLFPRGLGMTPRQLLPLTKIISSPKPPHSSFSPLRTFNPFIETTPTKDENESTSGMTTPPGDMSTSSSVTDVQDVVSISAHWISPDSPEYSSLYNNISINVDVVFSSVYLVINLQTWVLLFDFLEIGVPTPASSPLATSPVSFEFSPPPLSKENDSLERYSLKTDGSIYIAPQYKLSQKNSQSSFTTESSPERDVRSTVWGVEGKMSAHIKLKVQSLSVTFNKPEHPLARGNASVLQAEVTLIQGNVRLKGSLGQASLVDLTDTGAYYRERFTTTGDEALNFDIFKFGRRDPHLVRPYDISANVQLSAVRYLHTMRFLKEILAFCTHFPQLIDAFQRMKAVSRGNLLYTPDRKPRILFEVEADGPMILIPKHAFSPEIMGGVIKRLTLCNRFLYDGDKGTLSQLRGCGSSDSSHSVPRVKSTPGRLSSLSSESRHLLHSNSGHGWLFGDHTHQSSSSHLMVDKEKIEEILSAHQGPCLLDCMELLLSEVDVFSARKKTAQPHVSLQDGYHYIIERDKGELLKERGTLKLLIERNLYEDFCRSVPDFHIDGTLSAVHLMLDKRQLEIIKGLIDMNLGEQIEEFEKPSTIIHDPVAQPMAAAVWTGFRFHIEFVGVKLEFLQSRAMPDLPGSLTRSLSLFDIQLSEFTFESHSDQTKTVDFTSNVVIVHDTRYEGYNPSDKPNVFEEVLKPRYLSKEATPAKSLQVEIHVIISPTHIKASILFNQIRLIGVINLLMELKQFVFDKLPEDDYIESMEEGSLDDIDSNVGEFTSPLLTSLRHSITNKLTKPKNEEVNKPDRDVKVGLSITETDLVVVEDLTNSASNAVVLKGTVVLHFHSPPKVKGPNTLHCSIDGLELFSCCVSHEDDTALSILDPVSIGVELKPLDTPSSNEGTHTLEFDVRQLNVRLSYNDIKLFLAIIQNLQLNSLQKTEPTDIKQKQFLTPSNEKLVKRLLPLGFSRTAILKELSRSGGDINTAALLIIEEEERNEREKEMNKRMQLYSLEVIIGSLNLYLIDDSLDHDVPLLELSLTSLQAANQTVLGIKGSAVTMLSLDYYNRNISAWEPILEPWKVQFVWQKIIHFSTDLDTNEKPDRFSLSVTSPEQLNINLTSSLLLLFEETQASWSSDLQIESTHEQKEKQLIRLHHRSSSREINKDEGATPSGESHQVSNVQQGLALLHSVRFISQSRQRTKFIPFVLRNSTGLRLRFATLTSLPAKVLFNPSTLLQSPKDGSPILSSGLATPTCWIEVQPDEEKPFDFVSRQKLRHKDTRALIVHQLRVHIEGWEEISVPISVDKIGIFFRDIYQSDGRGQVKLFFAISLSGTQKIINVRSGLVIHNTLELPVEVKLEPPSTENGHSFGLPVIPPQKFVAVPLHLTNWEIKVRPQGWGLKFCSQPLTWQQLSSRTPKSDLRLCEAIGDSTRPPFRFSVQVTQEYFPLSANGAPPPGHTISLQPTFTVTNLLPYGFHFCFLKKEKYVPPGKEVSIHTVNPHRPVTFSISKLENFDFSEDCTVSIEEVGVVESLIVRDTAHRPLSLSVTTELIGRGSLQVSIWCPYWLINRTGLPLIFCAQGDPHGEQTAGQFEEHETASGVSPLLYSYCEEDLLQKCQIRLGRGQEEGHPNWSSGFRMIREGGVMRLFVRRGEGRPNREYQIGMEIQQGRDKYQQTRLVTFVARFQLENKTSFKLGYLQRHLVSEKSATKNMPVILPGSIMAFHWPRADLDQLLCIKVIDLSDSHWSGGFPLEQDKSFHINMRCSYGRSVFIRCEVIQRGATYHVIFSDASDYPPPFKLENLSQVPVLCYQHGITQQHQHTTLNSGQSVPYSWDEVTLPERLCIHIKGASEPRQFNLSTFGPQGKVYYESYFYIVAVGTKTDQSHLPESQQINGELVLDVPQGRAVLLTRKGLERRSQLWRMTAQGQLVHVATSSNVSTNYVLDLSAPLPKGSYRDYQPIPLVLSRMSSSRSSTQTWAFHDGRLILAEYPYLCVQCRRGYESQMEGVDAVIGQVGGGEREEFHKIKQSAGSGVLSVTIIPDGPTRVLQITDENKKYTYSSIKDDWVIIDHGLVAPAKVTNVDPTPEEEDEIKLELSLSLSLEKGISISLINSVPEELIVASATGIRMEYVSTAVHQCLNATIQYIQVDNQMAGGYTSVLAFPTPPSSGQIDLNYPVITCFIERLPHKSPLAIVFRTVDIKMKMFTLLLEEKLLFKILQWAGIGACRGNQDISQELMISKTKHWSSTSSLPSRQLYIEQLKVNTTEFLVSMHTTSQLPEDLQRIKKQLGFPLIQFESPILLQGYQISHMLGTPVLFFDAIGKHYKKVIQGQAVKILGSVDFLGNPMGLISDVASGVQGMIALQPDVVGLVRDVAHGMSDTTSKLTGTVSHVLGQASGDSSFQEEREQNLESCQTSSDHFKAGLINLTSGIFGGVTSILTQPYKGAMEEGMSGFIVGIGKGVVGTVTKPVAGLLDFASGTTAALRETMSRVSRQVPRPMRLRRCCVGATGALTCYSVQLARGQEYLLRLNDGNILEKLVAYEKFSTGSLLGEMRVIISSKCLYFFEDSPPDPTSLDALFGLDQLVECRATQAKTTIPTVYLVLSVRVKEEAGVVGSVIRAKKYKCLNDAEARKIAQLINYAKTLHNEEKMIIRTPRLQNETLW